jgi:predicted O-methyltransferase YrrM
MLKTNITPELHQYTLDIGMREPRIAQELRAYTVAHFKNHQMLTAPEQCQFIALLAKLINAQSYLEIGVFTGYSTLIMALALKDNYKNSNQNSQQNNNDNSSQNSNRLKIVALDNNQKHLDTAMQFWQMAQVNDIITPICGNALQSLEMLWNDYNSNNYEDFQQPNKLFDIAYIDANKSDYLAYYEYAYKLVRHGGIILIDNILMGGQVSNLADNLCKTPNYVDSVRQFNQFIHTDSRVDISVLPIGDGLTIAYKRHS